VTHADTDYAGLAPDQQDRNGDGRSDIVEVDTDHDQRMDEKYVDANDDGRWDHRYVDTNHNGHYDKKIPMWEATG
jgi:hypothetical protein